ncbi:MAG: hypothetical protein JWM24_1831 [Solirubrobacterales bacterium]|nr:hypothetical protein [Solirubrobacterales bacterium]
MWAAFCFCVPAAKFIDLCKRLWTKPVAVRTAYGGQLGSRNADSQLPGVLVSIRHDHRR